MLEKIIGYLLLVAGLAIIFFSVFSVYNVFTKRAEPFDLFTFGGVTLDLNSLIASSLPPEQKAQIPKNETELITSNMINQPINIVFHLLLMGFIAGAGFKIASVGAILIRPLKVNFKEASSVVPSANQQKENRK